MQDLDGSDKNHAGGFEDSDDDDQEHVALVDKVVTNVSHSVTCPSRMK